MSDFLPPDLGDGGWLPPEGSNPPPDASYEFFGYFYSGANAEVCQGVWLKDDIFDPTETKNPSLDETINIGLTEGITGMFTSLLGIEKLIAEEDVPDKARREATGYLTLGEAYERGNRLPNGLEWSIYRKNGSYYLAIGDSP